MLERNLSDTKVPLNIAEVCLIQREKRTGIDMVHDNVEKTLTKVRIMRNVRLEMYSAT